MKQICFVVVALLVAIVADEILSWLFLLLACGLLFGKLFREAEK